MALSASDQLDILDIITRADAAASRRDADAYAADCLGQQAWRAYGQLQRQGSDPAKTSCTEVSAG